MDFFDEIARITRAHCEVMGYTKPAAARVAGGVAAIPSVDDVTAKEQSAATPLGDGVEGAAVTPIDRDSELYRKLSKCRWTQTESGQYDTACGNCFEIMEGSPTENHMKFCCYCGKPLVDVPYVEETDDDDDYARQDAESPRNVTNHSMTEDQRLDDPRHGQGDK